MRPPICAICDNDFRASMSEEGLVSFKLSDKEIEENKRFEDSKITGHPAGLEWFCKDHYEKAKKLSHLTKREAIKQMSLPVYLNESTVSIEESNVIALFNVINKNWDEIIEFFIEDKNIRLMKPTLKQDKSWSPMDNCVPPNCPYVLNAENKVEQGLTSITNHYYVSYWNENEVSNSQYSFQVIIESKSIFGISTYSSGQDKIDSITLVSNELSKIEFEEVKNKLLRLLR